MPQDVIKFSISDTADQLRMDAYQSIFSEAGHLWLAMHAAFPIVLTTDLLYKIWLNFIPAEADTNDTFFGQLSKQISKQESSNDNSIAINAVGDLLLSPLCREIGYDLYEFYPHLKETLWKSLPIERQRQLANFLLRYLEFCPDKIPSEAFAESQRVWAQITLGQFDKVSELLGEIYKTPNSQYTASKRDFILNLVAQTATVTKESSGNQQSGVPAADLARLAQGISAYKQGNHEEALNFLETVRHKISIEKTTKGFHVPIPKNLWESFPPNIPAKAPKKGEIYAVLVGIDRYGDGMLNKEFKGCITDANSWQMLLKTYHPNASITLLLDAQATRNAIVQTLQDTINHLTPGDTLLFTFSGHAHNKDSPQALAAHDSTAAQRETYLSENEFRNLIESVQSENTYIVVILDTHAGSPGWIDSNNTKQVLLSATANGEISFEVDDKGLFTEALQTALKGNKQPVSYRSLIRDAYHFIKEKKYEQTPQLFGHSTAINQGFLEGSPNQNTYIKELLQRSGYPNIKAFLKDFEIEDREDEIIATLEKYSLIAGKEKLRMVRISSEMNVSQIQTFRQEYIRKLPYGIEIIDISLLYPPARGGLKDALIPEDEIKDNLTALQNVQIIVFVLNPALVKDFGRHATIGPVINFLSRFENKVVCSILWEDCEWQSTFLKDYPVFSAKEPLIKNASGITAELEIKNYSNDWKSVREKWSGELLDDEDYFYADDLKYYNPPREIEEKGRKLVYDINLTNNESWSFLNKQVQKSEILVGRYRNQVSAEVAAHIYSRERLKEIKKSWSPVEYYAIDIRLARNKFYSPITDKFIDNFLARNLRKQIKKLHSERKIIVADDLQKFRWGEKNHLDGFELDATVEESSDKNFTITLIISSKRECIGKSVAIFLHDTFGLNEVIYKTFETNEIMVEISAYEAFTIGAFIEGGTELELDLMENSEYPEKFYYDQYLRILWLGDSSAYTDTIQFLSKLGITVYQIDSLETLAKIKKKPKFDFILADITNHVLISEKLLGSKPVIYYSEKNFLQADALQHLMSKRMLDVLLIDPRNYIRLLIKLVPKHIVNFKVVNSLSEGLDMLDERSYDLIISEVGKSTKKRSSENDLDKVQQRNRQIPMIFYSSETKIEPIVLEELTNGALVTANIQVSYLTGFLTKFFQSILKWL